MNIKISDEKLLGYLNNKYKTDYFVFVNQLDIKNDENTYDLTTNLYQREVTVHYSIIDKTGKNISAGISTAHFSSKENEPKKIVSQSFSPISTYIASQLTSVIKHSTDGGQKK